MIILYVRYDYRSVSRDNHVKANFFFAFNIFLCVLQCALLFIYLENIYKLRINVQFVRCKTLLISFSRYKLILEVKCSFDRRINLMENATIFSIFHERANQNHISIHYIQQTYRIESTISIFAVRIILIVLCTGAFGPLWQAREAIV